MRLLPLVEPLTQLGRIPGPTGWFRRARRLGAGRSAGVLPGAGGLALFVLRPAVSEALDCLIPGVGGAELLVVVEPVPVFDREAVALSHRRAAGCPPEPARVPDPESCQGAARSHLGLSISIEPQQLALRRATCALLDAIKPERVVRTVLTSANVRLVLICLGLR